MKHFLDLPCFESVRAVALLKGGEFCGKIIARYTDNGKGGTCFVSAVFYNNADIPGATGPLDFSLVGKASGCGYDKFGAALMQYFKLNGLHYAQLSKIDSGSYESWFSDLGIECHTLL